MSIFIKQGDYTNGTIIDGSEKMNEYINIYEAFNGESIDKEIIHRFNGANPALILDQLGVGNIIDLNVGGVNKLTVNVNGKIVSQNTTIIDNFTWLVEDVDDLPVDIFIVPVNAVAVTKFGVVWSGEGVTGGQTAIRVLQKNGVDMTNNLQFNGGITANVPITISGSNITQPSIVAGDIITIVSGGSPSGWTAKGFTYFVQYSKKIFI